MWLGKAHKFLRKVTAAVHRKTEEYAPQTSKNNWHPSIDALLYFTRVVFGLNSLGRATCLAGPLMLCDFRACLFVFQSIRARSGEAWKRVNDVAAGMCG